MPSQILKKIYEKQNFPTNVKELLDSATLVTGETPNAKNVLYGFVDQKVAWKALGFWNGSTFEVAKVLSCNGTNMEWSGGNK